MPFEFTAFFWPILLAFFLFGLCVGSFLNVVIWRLPRGQSLVSPPSRCPRCGHRISALENIPVFSWLWLRGRCRGCHLPISWRYPLVELGIGLGWALLFAVFVHFEYPAGALPRCLLLLPLLLALAMVDIDLRRLPDALTWPGIVAGLISRLFWPDILPLATGPWARLDVHCLLGETSYTTSVLAGVLDALGGILLSMAFLILAALGSGWLRRGRASGLGGGDIKMAGLVGCYLGLASVLPVLLLATLAALVGGLAWPRWRRRGIPYGLFLAIAAAAVLATGGLWPRIFPAS